MVQPKKFRGVRQRRWGSWVAETRHPLLKKRVWLGTFGTAEEAARVYDQSAIIFCGRNAKTNFPIPESSSKEDSWHYKHMRPLNDKKDDNQQDLEKQEGKPLSSSYTSSSSSNRLSEVLHEKLKRITKISSPSMTCIRLDTETNFIGVWQKWAGPTSESRWVTKVKLGNSNPETRNQDDINGRIDNNNNCERVLEAHCLEATTLMVGSSNGIRGGGDDQCSFSNEMDEEERIALQMIEELLS